MRTRIALLATSLVALAARPADAGSCVPGFDYAIFAKNGIHIQGNAGTDSYDSSVGPYASTHACSDSDIGTNSTAGGKIHVQSASTTVCGDAIVGAGGNPAVVITGNGTITGSKSAQTANTVLGNVTFPTGLANGSPFSPSTNNANTTLTPNRTYGNVSCKNGSLTLQAGKYIINKLTLTANCQLIMGGGPIEVYFSSALEMQAGVVVNSSNIPGNLVFYGGAAATGVQLQGGVDAAFAVYAPAASCELQGNVDMFGAMVCDSASVQGNADIHYDRALANLGGGGFSCPVKEVSRATPIVATLEGQDAVVQGTYEVASTSKTTITTTGDIAGFTFPHLKGHMRARVASSISTTGSTFSSGTVLFDAGASGKIPTVNTAGCSSYDGSCRNVFTVTQTPNNDGTSFHPPLVQLNDTNASAIGALIAPSSVVTGITAANWQTIVQKVLAGGLGGVDRSTVAVIPASPIAGNAARPTIAYFGASDGMLHAVCASTGGTTESDTNICPSLGTELWAFLPRVQLPLVRTNTTRIDGSVRVVDVFGDFSNPATGTRSFRTILTFQTGYAETGAPPAVYALDVTDPANPIVVWEYTQPATATSFDLGVGLAMTAGPVLVDNKPTNLAIAETNNGGTGGTGVVAVAIDLETGTKRWQFDYAYPSPPRGNAADLPLPTTGVPGGAVGVDLLKTGYLSEVVMGDLYGNLWRLDAATGASRTGTSTPLFRHASNKKPIGALPAIYSDGNAQFAVFGTGGYADPLTAAWSAGTQSLISVSLTAAGPYPLDDSSSKLAFKQDLSAGEKAFGQVLVVGQEVFVTTDTTDVNLATYGTGGNTGHAFAFDLTTSTASTAVVVRGGAASLANAGTTLYSSSSDQQQELPTAAAGTTGATVDGGVVPKLERKLWLRTQ